MLALSRLPCGNQQTDIVLTAVEAALYFINIVIGKIWGRLKIHELAIQSAMRINLYVKYDWYEIVGQFLIAFQKQRDLRAC